MNLTKDKIGGEPFALKFIEMKAFHARDTS